MRFADEVQTLEYTPESWTSTSKKGGVRRKGDAGRLWKDEDLGESEGQEVRKINNRVIRKLWLRNASRRYPRVSGRGR